MRRVRAQGFTLIELLVVVAIIAVLIAILLPSLAKARASGYRAKCLSNMRSLETAHCMYMDDNQGQFIRVGLAHGGLHASPLGWFNTLQEYFGKQTLLVRSPVDTSPHWGPYPEGKPIPNADPTQRRITSYGVNDFLDIDTCPWGGPYTINNVPSPVNTIHFLIMAFEGDFAGADHPHVESWSGPQAPAKASLQVQTNAHGGLPGSWDAVSNWGFLDGHAETLSFRQVFSGFQSNKFDPQLYR